MKRGKFIVFAGINGSGKSTQMGLFVPWLMGLDKNNLVFCTREPNALDDNGRKAREQLKKDKDPYANAQEALILYCENRRTHNGIFGPLLEKGIHVVSDRYYDSTLVYQGLQGISYRDISNANRDFLRPNMTFVLDVHAAVAMKRLEDSKREETGRKFENDFDFAQKVEREYKRLPIVLRECLHDYSGVLIDGNRDEKKVQEEIRTRFIARFSH